jgi:hypothetical protein
MKYLNAVFPNPATQKEQAGVIRTMISFIFGICALLGLTSNPLYGQQWPLGHQPSRYSVPQYGSHIQSQPNHAPNSTGHNNSIPVPAHNGQQDMVYPLFESTDEPLPHENEQPVESLPMSPLVEPQGNNTPILTSPQVPPFSHPFPNTQTSPRYGLDYSIYRDFNPHPIDPRKPCNECCLLYTSPSPRDRG